MKGFDGFRADVEPGGLYNVEEIKILICVILHTLEMPFDANTISNIIRYDNLANYFDVAQATGELHKEGVIVKGESDEYSLSDTGAVIARELARDIPFTVREKAVRAAKYELLLRRRLKDNKIEFVPLQGDKYMVKISMLDGDTEFMAISIRVSSYEEAARVRANFLNDPGEIYNTNFRKLLGLADPAIDV